VPFVSQKQNDKCWAMKARGQGKGWNCREWAEHTNYDKIPTRKRSKKGSAPLTLIEALAAAAAEVTLRGG
jgi:hypothetical protein